MIHLTEVSTIWWLIPINCKERSNSVKLIRNKLQSEIFNTPCANSLDSLTLCCLKIWKKETLRKSLKQFVIQFNLSTRQNDFDMVNYYSNIIIIQ